MMRMALNEFASRSVYYLTDYWDEIGDPRTAELPFVAGGITNILAVIAAYLAITRVLLPLYMRGRAAYEMRGLMFAYNVVMVLANAYLFVIAVANCECGRIWLNFSYPSRADRSLATLAFLRTEWLFWMTRFMDLFDTVFFVLRKKESQISFLHLYHHSVVPLLCWLCLKVNPMAPIVRLFGVCNTLIHVVMYFYYALSSRAELQKYLWWKKYITQLQIAQFAICGAYGVILACLQTGYPMGWFLVSVGQNPIFLYMFYDFYRQSYRHHNQYHKKS